jgi:hypothetical protein
MIQEIGVAVKNIGKMGRREAGYELMPRETR